MNEATLEARVNGELARLFPTLAPTRLEHQLVFTLTFGTTSITVDGRRQDRALGRLDVLLSVDGKPLAVLELKRPGVALTDEDRDQAISYARLTEPVAPLAIVSNGATVCFFRSCDKAPWAPESRDEAAVQALFTHALAAAAVDRDAAVRLLLGQDPALWEQIFLTHSADALAELHGALDDVTRPIARDLSIDREIVPMIERDLKEHTTVVLMGPPLGGKTTIVAQLCGRAPGNGLTPVFIDASSQRGGLLRHLAAVFSTRLFRATSEAETRQWLLQGLRGGGGPRLVIVVDGWLPNDHDELLRDVTELSTLASDRKYSLLLVLDENTWELISRVPGRSTSTALGRAARVRRCAKFSDSEFQRAAERALHGLGVGFMHGAQESLDYREPRVFRSAVANVAATAPAATQRASEKTRGVMSVVMLPAIPGLMLLDMASKQLAADLQLKQDFLTFAEALVRDGASYADDPGAQLFAHGTGAIRLSTAESMLGAARLDRLRQQGLIRLVHGPLGKVFTLSRVPEYLAAAGAQVVGDRIATALQQDDVDSAYRALLEQTTSFPLSDVVGAHALTKGLEGDRRNQALSALIPRLLEDEPEASEVEPSSRALIHFPEEGVHEIPLGEIAGGDPESRVWRNVQPWLLLSHVATLALGDERGDRDVQLEIFSRIGDFDGILRQPDVVRLEELRPWRMHDLRGIGIVPCSHAGIVEPITQALVEGFGTMPSDMPRLALWAVENDRPKLAFRLSIAAKYSQSARLPDMARASREVMRILGPFISQVLSEPDSSGKTAGEDPAETPEM